MYFEAASVPFIEYCYVPRYIDHRSLFTHHFRCIRRAKLAFDYSCSLDPELDSFLSFEEFFQLKSNVGRDEEDADSEFTRIKNRVSSISDDKLKDLIFTIKNNAADFVEALFDMNVDLHCVETISSSSQSRSRGSSATTSLSEGKSSPISPKGKSGQNERLVLSPPKGTPPRSSIRSDKSSERRRRSSLKKVCVVFNPRLKCLRKRRLRVSPVPSARSSLGKRSVLVTVSEVEKKESVIGDPEVVSIKKPKLSLIADNARPSIIRNTLTEVPESPKKKKPIILRKDSITARVLEYEKFRDTYFLTDSEEPSGELRAARLLDLIPTFQEKMNKLYNDLLDFRSRLHITEYKVQPFTMLLSSQNEDPTLLCVSNDENSNENIITTITDTGKSRFKYRIRFPYPHSEMDLDPEIKYLKHEFKDWPHIPYESQIPRVCPVAYTKYVYPVFKVTDRLIEERYSSTPLVPTQCINQDDLDIVYRNEIDRYIVSQVIPWHEKTGKGRKAVPITIPHHVFLKRFGEKLADPGSEDEIDTLNLNVNPHRKTRCPLSFTSQVIDYLDSKKREDNEELLKMQRMVRAQSTFSRSTFSEKDKSELEEMKTHFSSSRVDDMPLPIVTWYPFGQGYRPITRYLLNEARDALGLLPLDWTSFDDHPLKGVIPSQAITYTRKERLLLLYLFNFCRKFRHKCPYRVRRLFLIADNEYGKMKFVCSYLKPTRWFYRKFATWEGCARWLSNTFEVEPLGNYYNLPRQMRSPRPVFKERKGNVFELANIMESLLLGAGYDAYIVCGRVAMKKIVGNTGELDKDIKVKVDDDSEDDGEPEEVTCEYDHCDDYLLDSQYWRWKMVADQEKADQEKERQRLQELLQRENEFLRGKSDLMYDHLYSYVHCWILIRAGQRGVEENFYLELKTGVSFPVTDRDYHEIQCVWNHRNYYIPRYPNNLRKETVRFNLRNTTLWCHLLLAEPFERRRLKRMAGTKLNRRVEAEKHIDIPDSWIQKLHLRPRSFSRYPWPHGTHTFKYKKKHIQVFLPNTTKSGISKKITFFEDIEEKKVLISYELFNQRKDCLTTTVYTPPNNQLKEYFEFGRSDHIKRIIGSKDDSEVYSERTISYFWFMRIDGLRTLRQEKGKWYLNFKGRMDRLSLIEVEFGAVYPKRVIHGTAMPMRQIVYLIKFYEPDSKSERQDSGKLLIMESDFKLGLTRYVHYGDYGMPYVRAVYDPNSKDEEGDTQTVDALIESMNLDWSFQDEEYYQNTEGRIAYRHDVFDTQRSDLQYIRTLEANIAGLLEKRREESTESVYIDDFYTLSSTGKIKKQRAKEFKQKMIEEEECIGKIPVDKLQGIFDLIGQPTKSDHLEFDMQKLGYDMYFLKHKLAYLEDANTALDMLTEQINEIENYKRNVRKESKNPNDPDFDLWFEKHAKKINKGYLAVSVIKEQLINFIDRCKTNLKMQKEKLKTDRRVLTVNLKAYNEGVITDDGDMEEDEIEEEVLESAASSSSQPTAKSRASARKASKANDSKNESRKSEEEGEIDLEYKEFSHVDFDAEEESRLDRERRLAEYKELEYMPKDFYLKCINMPAHNEEDSNYSLDSKSEMFLGSDNMSKIEEVCVNPQIESLAKVLERRKRRMERIKKAKKALEGKPATAAPEDVKAGSGRESISAKQDATTNATEIPDRSGSDLKEGTQEELGEKGEEEEKAKPDEGEDNTPVEKAKPEEELEEDDSEEETATDEGTDEAKDTDEDADEEESEATGEKDTEEVQGEEDEVKEAEGNEEEVIKKGSPKEAEQLETISETQSPKSSWYEEVFFNIRSHKPIYSPSELTMESSHSLSDQWVQHGYSEDTYKERIRDLENRMWLCFKANLFIDPKEHFKTIVNNVSNIITNTNSLQFIKNLEESLQFRQQIENCMMLYYGVKHYFEDYAGPLSGWVVRDSGNRDIAYMNFFPMKRIEMDQLLLFKLNQLNYLRPYPSHLDFIDQGVIDYNESQKLKFYKRLDKAELGEEFLRKEAKEPFDPKAYLGQFADFFSSLGGKFPFEFPELSEKEEIEESLEFDVDLTWAEKSIKRIFDQYFKVKQRRDDWNTRMTMLLFSHFVPESEDNLIWGDAGYDDRPPPRGVIEVHYEQYREWKEKHPLREDYFDKMELSTPSAISSSTKSEKEALLEEKSLEEVEEQVEAAEQIEEEIPEGPVEEAAEEESKIEEVEEIVSIVSMTTPEITESEPVKEEVVLPPPPIQIKPTQEQILKYQRLKKLMSMTELSENRIDKTQELLKEVKNEPYDDIYLVEFPHSKSQTESDRKNLEIVSENFDFSMQSQTSKVILKKPKARLVELIYEESESIKEGKEDEYGKWDVNSLSAVDEESRLSSKRYMEIGSSETNERVTLTGTDKNGETKTISSRSQDIERTEKSLESEEEYEEERDYKFPVSIMNYLNEIEERNAGGQKHKEKIPLNEYTVVFSDIDLSDATSEESDEDYCEPPTELAPQESEKKEDVVKRSEKEEWIRRVVKLNLKEEDTEDEEEKNKEEEMKMEKKKQRIRKIYSEEEIEEVAASEESVIEKKLEIHEGNASNESDLLNEELSLKMQREESTPKMNAQAICERLEEENVQYGTQPETSELNFDKVKAALDIQQIEEDLKKELEDLDRKEVTLEIPSPVDSSVWKREKVMDKYCEDAVLENNVKAFTEYLDKVITRRKPPGLIPKIYPITRKAKRKLDRIKKRQQEEEEKNKKKESEADSEVSEEEDSLLETPSASSVEQFTRKDVYVGVGSSTSESISTSALSFDEFQATEEEKEKREKKEFVTRMFESTYSDKIDFDITRCVVPKKEKLRSVYGDRTNKTEFRIHRRR